MVICIAGRLPSISRAEMERSFGAARTQVFSPGAIVVDTGSFDIETYGSIVKAGRVVAEFPVSSWHEVSKKIAHHYTTNWKDASGKITLGISVYEKDVSSRDIQQCAIIIKSKLKSRGVSMRVVPNAEPVLSSATSHHNKLGLSANKVELLVVFGKKSVIVAESVGAQNITALAARDQARPHTDAFVGMLPPKLALTMVNLTGIRQSDSNDLTVLDPFCGTGVILQEASLLGYRAYGTDLSEKMVDYSTKNLAWLAKKYPSIAPARVHHGDAIETTWQPPIDAVASEVYLGQPFSAFPAPDKLTQVVGVCDMIFSKFLQNIAPQIATDTPLCLAIPAWRDTQGNLTHLPSSEKVGALGFKLIHLQHVAPEELVYFREDQVVARQLLLLCKK